jgi:putative membrane protein
MKTNFPAVLPRRHPWRLATFMLTGCGLSVSLCAMVPNPVRRVTARAVLNTYGPEFVATDDLRPSERAFLTQAMESVRQQMRLAEVGVAQAENAEVRNHASQLATDYRALSDALDGLLQRKGGIAGAPVGGTSESYQKLTSKNGTDFDREFVRTVATGSNAIMTLFEQAAANLRDVDVRNLAASELPVLRAHRNAIVDLKRTFD